MSTLLARHHRRRADGAAFTLIELIVTIVILGVLAALAIPAFRAVIERADLATEEAYWEAVARGATALAAFDQTVAMPSHVAEIVNDGTAAATTPTAPSGYTWENGDGVLSDGEYLAMYDAAGDLWVFANPADLDPVVIAVEVDDANSFGVLSIVPDAEDMTVDEELTVPDSDDPNLEGPDADAGTDTFDGTSGTGMETLADENDGVASGSGGSGGSGGESGGSGPAIGAPAPLTGTDSGLTASSFPGLDAGTHLQDVVATDSATAFMLSAFPTGLYAVDASDPSAMTVTDHLTEADGMAINARRMALHASSNRILIASYDPSGTDFITTIDISDPAAMVVTDTLTGFEMGTPLDADIEGDRLYVATGNGLFIFDISGASPVLAGSYTSLTNIYGFVVDGNIAYLPMLSLDGVRAIDVSVPSSITTVGQLTNASPGFGGDMNAAIQVEKVGDHIAVSGAGGGLGFVNIIDASDPANMSYVTSFGDAAFNVNNSGAGRYASYGEYLYVSEHNTGTITTFHVPASGLATQVAQHVPALYSKLTDAAFADGALFPYTQVSTAELYVANSPN